MKKQHLSCIITIHIKRTLAPEQHVEIIYNIYTAWLTRKWVPLISFRIVCISFCTYNFQERSTPSPTFSRAANMFSYRKLNLEVAQNCSQRTGGDGPWSYSSVLTKIVYLLQLFVGNKHTLICILSIWMELLLPGPRSANLNFPRIYSSAPNFEEVLIPNPTFQNNIKNCSKLDRINNRVFFF